MTACLLALGMSMQAKDYQYKTVEGDLTKARIYTLDNGLKVYLTYSDFHSRSHRFEERSCRDNRFGSLSGAPDVQGHQTVWYK